MKQVMATSTIAMLLVMLALFTRIMQMLSSVSISGLMVIPGQRCLVEKETEHSNG